jgi:PKHD-type hydroxylase
VLICIPQVLKKAEVALFRRTMDAAEWIDGRGTAGAQSATVKHNMQLPEGSPAARGLGDRVLDALACCPLIRHWADA